MAGWSLVEALLASLVLSVGMGLLLRGQAATRAYADLARERAGAAVLAEAQVERLRGSLPDAGPPAASEAGGPAPLLAPDSAGEADPTETTWHEELDSSRYRARQRVLAKAGSALRDIDLQLRWQDRFGEWQVMQWPARVALAHPATSLLALSVHTAGEVALSRARHAALPATAHVLSPEVLAFQPAPGLAEAWLLDARTGWVLGLCELGSHRVEELRASDVAECRSRMVGGGALLLSGEVRFDLEDSPSPDRPRSPALPLGLTLRLSDASASPAPPRCVSNAASVSAEGLGVVSYHCLVYPRSLDQRWSGRSELSGEAADLKRFRICRYSADHDHDGSISNPEHPSVYSDVEGPLTQQNFLVIRAGRPCPSGLPADPDVGRLLDTGTRPHQPPD